MKACFDPASAVRTSKSNTMGTTAYIALGSNLGERGENLERALQALQESPGVEVTQMSSFYETAPVGGPAGQENYLNACAELQTGVELRELLRVLLEVEQRLGRVRREHYGPRTIDLDLLVYGDRVIRDDVLTVPHPRLQERQFVLQPLAEIAPDVVHPLLGLTIRELLQQLGTADGASSSTQYPVPSTQYPVPGATSASSSSSASASHELVPSTQHSVPGTECLPEPKELKGLRAFVTGSSSGIGKAIALELASAGADVILHRRGEVAELEQLAEKIRSLGVRAHALQADLRLADACHELVDAAWRQWGAIDIWVNNAGADTLTGEAGRWAFEKKLQELLAVDVTATLLLSRDIGQRMKARGQGVILNMGWDQAETGMEGDSGQLFAAAKGAVMAFTKSLALTLAPEVRVNCLAPGWIRTAWAEGASQAWQDRAIRETPLGRWGRPEDVARTARWLVSPAAAFLPGHVIRFHGGSVR